MSVAFWSCKLSGGKAVEVQPPEGYVLNVQQAAITGEGHAVIKVKTVSVEGDKIDAVIATLRAKTTDQVNLSLVFGYDVPVSFVAEGKADVYLSGYYQPGPEEEGEDEDEENDFDNYDSEEDSEDDEDEEGSEDDDEEANIRNAEAAIAKLGAARKALKNAPAEDSEDDSEDEEEDSEDDSEEEKIDSAFVAKMVAKHGLAGKAPKSSRVEELESEEDSEEGSEDESEEEAPPVKVQKVAAKGVVTPSGQKPKPTTPAQNNNNNKPKTPNGGNNNQNNKTPNNNQGGNKNNNSAHKSGDKRKR